MKSKYLFPILGLAALGLVSFGTVQALAHNSTTSDGKTIVQKLAEKFNLQQGEVQQVFDGHKAQLKTDMQTKVSDRLSDAVTQGKITEEQKQKIVDKQKELQSQMEANRDTHKDMTPEQRREAMKQQREELEKWAKDNGIDTQYLMGYGMKGNHKGFRGGPRP